MFEAGSLLRSVNIYVVENVLHSAVALALVWLVLSIFKVRDPGTRIRLLLLPALVPLLSPILLYLLFTQRQSMPVLSLDKVLNLDIALNAFSLGPALGRFLTLALAAVALLLLLKGVVSIAALLYLPRRFHPLAPGDDPRLDAVLARAGMARPRVLLSSGRGYLCCAFGLFRPYLALSTDLLQGLSDAELEAALAHELGHLKRRDDWLSFTLLTLRNILFFNPVVHLLCRRLLREAEQASDDLALSYGPDRLAYAQALVKVSRLSLKTRQHRLMDTRFASRGLVLKQRVEHILEPAHPPIPRGHRWLPLGVTALLPVVLFFLC